MTACPTPTEVLDLLDALGETLAGVSEEVTAERRGIRTFRYRSVTVQLRSSSRAIQNVWIWPTARPRNVSKLCVSTPPASTTPPWRS